MPTPPSLSEAALLRAADAVRAVASGYRGTLALPPERTNVRLYGDENPLEAPGFEAKTRLLAEIDAYARGRDPRVRQVSASLPARGRWSRSSGRTAPSGARRAPAGAAVGQRGGRAGRPHGDRQLRPRRPRGLRARDRARDLAGRGGRGAAPGAGQSRGGAGAGRRARRGAGPRLAGHHAARGDRPRAGGRLQPQEDLGLRRPARPAGRGQGRHRGRRRHHSRPARLAHRRRRGHPRRTAPC